MKIQDNGKQMSINLPRYIEQLCGWTKGINLVITKLDPTTMVLSKVDIDIVEKEVKVEKVIPKSNLLVTPIHVNEHVYKEGHEQFVPINKVMKGDYVKPIPKAELDLKKKRGKLISLLVCSDIGSTSTSPSCKSANNTFIENLWGIGLESIEEFMDSLTLKEFNAKLEKIINWKSNVSVNKIQKLRARIKQNPEEEMIRH